MEQYTIKDLERLSGINAHTIRIWERRYNVINPSRTDTNRRRYDDRQLRKVINIAILRKNGLKISKIVSLSEHEIESRVAALSREMFNSDTQTDSLLMSVLNHNESEVNHIILRSVMERGFDFTITDLIFPFLKRIGVMWQTGAMGVASEHFASNIIRQKIISAIDSLPYATGKSRGKALLFLPDSEYHEIPLLAYNYLIRKEGFETLYLGQATPLDSAASICRSWDPDIVITYILSASPGIDIPGFAKEMAEAFPNKRIFAGGLITGDLLKGKYANLQIVSSFEEFMEKL
jgi:MerR family transcriptional regulator, light-induced transcriptional regulator